jgi:hypothetical protein
MHWNGVVAAQCIVIGSQRDTASHADCDRNVAAVRAQLDEATFAAAWAAGRAMTMEQAVAEALEEGLASPDC